MPDLTYFSEKALQITTDKAKVSAGLGSLMAAVLGDHEAKKFLSSRSIDFVSLQMIVNDHINVDSKDHEDSEFYNPELSDAAVSALDQAQEIIAQNSVLKVTADSLAGKEGLVLMAVMLRNFPSFTLSKTFKELNIQAHEVAVYLRSFGINLFEDDLLSNNDRALVKYEPVMDEGNVYLSSYTQCLNDEAAEGRLPPVVGRHEEIAQSIRVLRQLKKANPLLVGEPGVGKTAIVEGLAQMIAKGQVPQDLAHFKIFKLDLTKLIAGTMYRGMFEERIEGVLDELKDVDGAVLFVDEVHTLLDMRMGDMLKPALARGEIRCMAATTFDEFRKKLSKDKALVRRFEKITVNEPTLEDTCKILEGIKWKYEDHHECVIPSSLIPLIAQNAARYFRDSRMPDSAIQLMDMTGSMLKEVPLKDKIFGSPAGLPYATEEVVIKATAKKTGLPLESLSLSDKDRIVSLPTRLKDVVYGQDEAVNALTRAYKISRADLADPDKPIGSYLFTGPTGVGKTEVSKQMAETLGIPLVRLDMSEFMERHSVSKLLGAAPGYVGFDEGGLLTEPVHKARQCVLLLDEIEKAHPDVFNVLLQVMDHGELTDSAGKKVDFRNVILCMTSNAGEGGDAIHSIGFGKQTTSTTKDGDVEKTFFPEFRNRLDGIIRFNPLPREVLPRILGNVITGFERNLAARNARISFETPAQEWLIETGFDDTMGARPLKRVFKEHVIAPAADILIEQDFDKQGGTLNVSRAEDGLRITFTKGGLTPEPSRSRSLVPAIRPQEAGAGVVFATRRR